MEKRVRSKYFLMSGGLGGLVGFALMEAIDQIFMGSGSRVGDISRMAIYFAGFGLTVGAALGMTEGFVQKKRNRMIYGLTMGLILGGLGGFVGGAVGQAIFSLAPRKSVSHSSSDVVIALDSSGSMRVFLWLGHDPFGKRRSAAKELIDQLSGNDRVAVVDFDEAGKVYFPLASVNSDAAREAAKKAVNQIDDSGGTNLSAGLDLAIEELSRNRVKGRKHFVIFLTDGEGEYNGAAEVRARSEGIPIYTIGLGTDVEAGLLSSIAKKTGGKYYPVSSASQLSLLFQQIYVESGGNMASKATSSSSGTASGGGSTIQILLRILSWALMGLAIGAGQGVRENTREDLRACALGGLLGGAVGGAMFDPLANAITLGAGLVGRCLADVVVGACIGGSMRLVQERIVEGSGKATTTLLSVLPAKKGLALSGPGGHREKFVPGPPRPVPLPEKPAPVPVPVPAKQPHFPLASYQERYVDRTQAMAMAYRSGEFTLKEIAEYFGVQPTAVKRAAEQYPAI